MPHTFDRTFRFLAGLASVLLAQYVILQQEPLIAKLVFAPALNDLFRIDVPNLDNVIIATVMLIVGGWILAGVFSESSVSWVRSDSLPVGLLQLPALSSRLRRWMVGLILVMFLPFLFLIGQLTAKNDSNWLALVWIAVLSLIGYLAYLFDRHAGISLTPNVNGRDVALVILLVLFAVGIGAFDLSRKPFSLMGDEGSFWETAQAIVTGQYRPSIFDLGVYTYPILGSYYQALILKLFGLSLWSWRFASVLAGAAAVAPTYLLAREMFDRRVAVLAGAVMSVTPYMLAFERLGYNNSQSLLPVVLSLYLLYAGLKRASVLYVFLSGIAAGLGFYTYTGARLGLAAAVLFLAYLFLRRRSEARRTVAVLGFVLILGWGLTALPHITYGIATHPDLFSYKSTESLFPNVFYAQAYFPPEELDRDFPLIQTENVTFFYRPDLYARLLVRGAIRTFLVFHDAQIVTEHFIAGPLPGPVTVVFYFLGLLFVVANLRDDRFALLAVWFLSGLVLLSVISSFPPRYQHLVATIPAISIFIALGVTTAADFVASYLPKWRNKLAPVLVVASFGVIALVGLNNYFVTVQATYPPSFDQVMTFTAFNLQSPREIVYVYRKPEEKDYVPYGIVHIPTLAVFQTVAPDELVGDQFALEPGKAYIFFFHLSDQSTVVDYLSRTLGTTIEPQAYHISDSQDTALSYSFVATSSVGLH